MTPPSRQASHGRKHVVLGSRLLLLCVLLISVTPLTVTAYPIYQSAPVSPVVDPVGLATVIVEDQSLGVKFYVSEKLKTGSIGGYFELYAGVESEILGAVVRLDKPDDFPNSFDLTTRDVLKTTKIQVSALAGDYAGNLSLNLTPGWYALVFAATDLTHKKDDTPSKHIAVMPRVYTDLGDPLYFFGTTFGLADDAFEYRPDAVGMSGARMFLDTDPVSRLAGPSMLLLADAASPVPEPSATLLLLALGLAGLVGVAWRRRKS